MKKLFALLALILASSPAWATDPQFGAIRIEATQNVRHAFVSTKTQGSDATKVSKDEWNAAHVAPSILIASVPTGIVWPAQPAAVTEFCGGSTDYRWRANLTNTSTIRLTAQVLVAGAATSALRLQYTTDTMGATGWDYLDSVSGPSVSIAATGVTVSASVSVASAAKADVLLRLVGINGDGAGGAACYSGIRAATATMADSATTATTATTASALAGDGTNCSIGSAAQGVDASGNAQGCFAVPSGTGTVSGTNTGDQTTITGNAGTATALAANGANCAAGSFPLGVDASGAAESCAALPTTISGTANQISASAATGSITLSIPSSPTLPGTTTGTFSGNLTGNVTGNVTGSSGSTTGNAATATALAANGANCSAGSYPLGVDASGAAESCTVAFSAAVASGPTYCSSATGSDAYACNLSPAPASYASIIGVPLTFLASDVGNTGAATVSFNSVGAQAIVKVGATTTTALVTGDIRAGALVTVQWDGANFECLSCGGNGANLAIANTWALAQTFSGQVLGTAGSATAPGLSFSANTGTGLYQAANRMNVAIAQGDHWSFNAGGTTAEIQLGSTTQFSWNSSDPPTAPDGDTGLKRVAAGVVGPTSGSALTAPGWLQQTAGELALAGDYTNATATFSSTALSATLISGRTYNFTVNLLLSDSVAADGFKLDFNGGAATVTNFRVNCRATNDTTGATVAFTAATAAALATVMNVATLASTGTHMVTCNGTIVPSSSATFILRAAQNAHTTGTLTITKGSWISIRDASPL